MPYKHKVRGSNPLSPTTNSKALSNEGLFITRFASRKGAMGSFMQADDSRYQIGIDCGSKTVKICVCDEAGKLVYSSYQRHQSNIKTTLIEAVHKMAWHYGDLRGTVAITGSAGISVAKAIGLPFVQEVVATTKIVKKEYPLANAVIELGGEDAKVIYLTDGLEQRMNATCAGGTGGFIDNIAFMLGVKTAEMNKLALGATRTYPIASRCAVFAQTDIRPLMNAGAKATDLAASTFDAVVRQTLGGLACGRPITGTVVFLGGPFEFLSELSTRFRKALGLNAQTGICPTDAQFFTARGAGLYGAQLTYPTVLSLNQIEGRLKMATFHDTGLARLEPLFRNDTERQLFLERHAKAKLQRDELRQERGPLYVGIDAGSTAVKVCVVNQKGHFVWGRTQENRGDVLKTATELLSEMYLNFPHDHNLQDYVYVAHAVATGYGEDMLKACLGVDSGIVETTAHVQGALHVDPNATFVLDIGGQDMKAIWIKDGLVQNAVLNEACSSGCGSFLSGTAYSLKLKKDRFKEAAMNAKAPVDLGTKCTVFMNSRLKHAQKVGASAEDLAAGCAYSVVKNALFRIIGLHNLDSLGSNIVVQGGTFMDDAVLRAFELLSGRQVTRSDRSYLMGALGAALVARQRALSQGEDAHSTLIPLQDLKSFSPKRSAMKCEGCANSCTLSVVTTDDSHNYIGGNRCGKALELYATSQKNTLRGAPNAVAVERSLMANIPSVEASGLRGTIRLGLVNTLLSYEYAPFWHDFFCSLGFSVIMPKEQSHKIYQTDSAGAETVPSESVCYPAKLSHKHLKQLEQAGATHAFMPLYQRGVNCAVSTSYACALENGAGRSMPLAQHLISPTLPMASPSKFIKTDEAKETLSQTLNKLLAPLGDALAPEELQQAFQAGLAAQQAHQDKVRKANAKALAWVESDPHHHGVLLMGRPYHVDADTGHRIDEVLAGLGLAVISPTVITRDEAPRVEQPEQPNPWKRSSHMLRMANYTLLHQRLNVVALQSFGCLYDGVNIAEAGAFLQEHGRLFTALKVDEIADVSHLRIRLRTLAENIEQVEHTKHHQATAQREEAASLPSLRITQQLSPQLAALAEEGSVGAFAQLDAADVEAARSYTRDLCYSTAAIVGRALRIAQACPQLEKLTLPNVCQKCLLEAVPSILQRITNRSFTICWEDAWPLPTPNDTPAKEEAPLIGIVGTAPLVFDSFLNDNLACIIQSHRCTPVFPELQALFTEDVRYLEQLQRFYNQGVRSVIYLQSFGCVKGHVHARGALHELSQRFPGMNIVVLDYDPETSALNRENRILLTLAGALGE